MTRDNIIRAAQESGLIWGVTDAGIIASLERFAALVAAYEREECAKLCDRHAADFSVFDRQPYESMEAGAAGCAAAIRARSENNGQVE